MVNNCEQCQAHDDETKALMNRLFSEDEKALIAILMSMNIKFLNDARTKPGVKDMAKMKLKRDIDFCSTSLGKVMNTIDTEARERIAEGIRKDHRMQINISHQKCPHGATPSVE